MVTLGDLGIALRAKVPDGGRIFDQKSEIVRFEQRQQAAGVRTYGVFHARIEAVVHVSQHQVEIGIREADLFDFRDLLFLHAANERRTKIEEGPE